MSTAQADWDDQRRRKFISKMAEKYPGASCTETALMTEADRNAYWRGRMSASQEHLDSSRKACVAARQDERRKVLEEVEQKVGEVIGKFDNVAAVAVGGGPMRPAKIVALEEISSLLRALAGEVT